MRRVGITALARKLLVALWKYVEFGIVPEGAIIPFETNDPNKAATVIQRVRGVANETMSWDFAHRPSPKSPSFSERLGEAIELKPGVFGFRVDLKKLGRRR
jgi:hypothetical protein